ncbi:MAG: hypothetical protein DRJ07_18305 [Bacteroidetes bacterium]|nr:MAG: hypothetical protein DRJ07_18305 [Bacteroidota bacterium]
MKKLILIIAIVFSGMLMQAQIELKGIKLGEIYTGVIDETVGGYDMIFTSLGGISGAIGILKLNDGTVCQIAFQANDDSNSPERISESEAKMLIKGVENKFNVKLKNRGENGIYDKFYYVEKNGIVYCVTLDINNYMAPSTACVIVIQDSHLMDIKDSEQQELANQDF